MFRWHLTLWEADQSFEKIWDRLRLAGLHRSGQQSQPFGNQRKFCKRANLKFLYNLMPMQFDGSIGYSQFECNLLVGLSFHQQKENIPLACRQSGVKSPKCRKLVVLFLNSLVAR